MYLSTCIKYFLEIVLKYKYIKMYLSTFLVHYIYEVYIMYIYIYIYIKCVYIYTYILSIFR